MNKKGQFKYLCLGCKENNKDEVEICPGCLKLLLEGNEKVRRMLEKKDHDFKDPLVRALNKDIEH